MTRRLRWAVASGFASLGFASIGVLAHFRAPSRAPVIGVSAFAPYLLLGGPLGFGLLLAARRWLGVAAAAILCVPWVVTQAPLYVSADAPAGTRTLVVLTANLRLGKADPAALLDAVRRYHVDILMLQELTEPAQERLVAAGLDQLLPYSVSEPGEHARGTGLWSRYRLREVAKRHDITFPMMTAQVAVPGVDPAPFVVSLHVAGPWPNSRLWLADVGRLPRVLRRWAGPGSTIIGGDFNATPDVKQFRELLDTGYADAADQAGAGLTATFPANTWYPPLIAIDHVLTRGAVATDVSTVEISGSDHRALLAHVAFRAR